VVVLLRLLRFGDEPWRQVQLALALELSQAEVSNSLARSRYAGLLDESGRQVRKQALMDFLQYGIAYAFPARPGPVVRGIPTAHSGPPLNTLIQSDGEEYVWSSANGTVRGQAITPLYKNVPKAVRFDPALHEVLSLVDAVRVGRAREKNLAIQELRKRIFQ
jgi:hypothetical protein